MNPLILIGLIFFVFGLIVLFNEAALRVLVGVAFLLGGGYLLGKGFGLINA